MFWDKKEDKKGLPDLPTIKSPFNKELEVSSNLVKSPIAQKPEMKEDHDSNDDEDGLEVERHSLPSFPDSPISKGFSQSAIKDAISQEDLKEPAPIPTQKPSDKIIPEQSKKFKTVELNEEVVENNPYLTSINQFQTKTPSNKKVISANSAYSTSNTMSLGLPPTEDERPEIEEKIEPKPQSPAQKSDVFVKIDKFFSAKKALETIDNEINDIDSLLKKIRETKQKEERELANWEKQMTVIKSRIQNISDNIFEKTQ